MTKCVHPRKDHTLPLQLSMRLYSATPVRVQMRLRTPVIAALRKPYHQAAARFTTLSPAGILTTRDISITIGDPDEAYIYFDPEVGFSMKSSIMSQLGIGPVSLRRELSEPTIPLVFYHNTRHFAHGTSTILLQLRAQSLSTSFG